MFFTSIPSQVLQQMIKSAAIKPTVRKTDLQYTKEN